MKCDAPRLKEPLMTNSSDAAAAEGRTAKSSAERATPAIHLGSWMLGTARVVQGMDPSRAEVCAEWVSRHRRTMRRACWREPYIQGKANSRVESGTDFRFSVW